ncbi:alpha/beta fold hydrolase [Mobilicoccus caccae]|uniref:Poly(R)-hydroxyalkanoic acid synthase n=1 Tax=Mobilicoccus caccae TaxID=1859295 RepID=A0ABQ6IWY2_9MICO|nr:alpha/beta fold hydrolase [Mobilicoccus caccae]GMA41204.1 poly(R)-hydroxyalkanoic acid synthase [Mobilicoccus caccae]
MSVLASMLKLPRTVLETSNILLTTEDAVIGATRKDVVWTHRTTTLYRYRSNKRTHPVPVLLVFALINRPMIFDLRPGHSFVEFLLDRGFDVFLVDWGVPSDADNDMGLDNYVCDELTWAVREVRRASGSNEISILGWCIGAVLTAMYASLNRGGPARNLVLLTMPVDAEGALYTTWMGSDSFDEQEVVDGLGNVAGEIVDWANKMMKPVQNHVTTRRRLFEQVHDGTVNRVAYQAMSKWVADNPPFAGRAFSQWIRWMYKENRLVRGRMELRGKRVDLRNLDQSILVVTASADHIAPRESTLPLLDLVSSDDVEHMDRVGGHIGLMAGSKARKEIWPDIADWLEPRSQN